MSANNKLYLPVIRMFPTLFFGIKMGSITDKLSFFYCRLLFIVQLFIQVKWILQIAYRLQPIMLIKSVRNRYT